MYCINNPINNLDSSGHSWIGAFTQGVVSAYSYLAFSIASLFVEDIRDDMASIGWNLFNTSESLVLNSNKVSFYKGVPVIKFSSDFLSSFSFYSIFFNEYNNRSKDTIFHEYGHTLQARELDPVTYMLFYGIPSITINGLEKLGVCFGIEYLDYPWERSADIFSSKDFSNESRDTVAIAYFVTTQIFSNLLSWIIS